MDKLILLQDGSSTQYAINKPEFVIGRLPECDIQLQSNLVSRRHARVFKSADGMYLEDLGSGNGTTLNGQRVDKSVKLKHDDRIKIGPMLLRFELEKPPANTSIAQTLLGRPALNFHIQEDESGSTIMGSLESPTTFGFLEVRPQEKLKAIIEISRALAGTIEVERILPLILDTLFAIYPAADRGCILLKDERTGGLVPRAMKHRRPDGDDSVKLSRTILKKVLEEKQAILSADAGSDSRFTASESISSLTIRSMMCVPLLDLQGDPIGIINVDTLNPLKQFKNDDLDIMVAIAGQAALSYETARLLSSFVEKKKQDSEMRIAADVQHALLPADLPHVGDYEFFAAYEAAQAVGGDYYDIIPLEGGKLCLAFGDVAGKGVPASLVMSRLSAVVRSTVEFVHDAAEAVTRINDHMCAKAVEGRFVTFVLVILDTVQHTMSLVNAGHMSPLIRKTDGTVEEFSDEAIGLPLGVMEGYTYASVSRDLHAGETVVIYTDGVSEAMNPKNELYTIEHLREFVSKGKSQCSLLGPAIREDVKRHAAGRAQNDDITLMVFGRN